MTSKKRSAFGHRLSLVARTKARIAGQYPVPIPRPRDIIKARTHPEFGSLLERIWQNLSHEVATTTQTEIAWGDYSTGL